MSILFIAALPVIGVIAVALFIQRRQETR